MRRFATCTALAVILLLGADNPLEGDKFLQKADEKFEQAMTRAQESYAKLAGEAFDTRLKTYRSILAAATKAGDFDRATAVKARIEKIEMQRDRLAATPNAGKKARIPEGAVKQGGHTFALIKDQATWYVARQRCEELGGHLAITRTREEFDLAMKLCSAAGIKAAWIGATDELVEGKWQWVDGTDATITGRTIDNDRGLEHYVGVSVDAGYTDSCAGARWPYICEWD